MEPDLPGEAVREQVEAPGGEEAAVVVGWEERAPALDPAGIACAPIAEQQFLTK